MDLAKIQSLIDGLCNFAVVGLILFAVGSIVVFYKVFKHDLSQD
jgi:hypothetical protein